MHFILPSLEHRSSDEVPGLKGCGFQQSGSDSQEAHETFVLQRVQAVPEAHQASY